jgi:hypothetical protein
LVVTGLAAVTGPTGVAPASAASVVTARHLEAGHFRVSSFNVLGASHTRHSKKWDSGSRRIVRVNRLLNRHHVQVAGFQEMQATQATKFLRITKGSWDLYPGTTLKALDSDNSIGWRTDKFELLQSTMVRIPYFDGHARAMPLVLLRDKTSGMMVYVANYHNAAETPQYRHQGKWRVAASRVEMALQNVLAKKGIPRILTGDMNERASYFCRMTAGAPLRAARPTSVRHHGVCDAGKPRAVDWILGSRRAVYTGYVEDRSHLVDITTDHPVIASDVTIDPSRLPKGWAGTPSPVAFDSGY